MFPYKTHIIAIITSIVVEMSGGAAAAPTSCPNHFPGGLAPDLTGPPIDLKTREICESAFAVLHSGVNRAPVYSAEHLTRESVAQAGRLKRPANPFHPDERLPIDERAELKDYRRSGYDRGHMAPSADMPTREAQIESFSLANMIPQNGDNNRQLWRRIESAVRGLGEREGDLYVVSGPVYLQGETESVGGRVRIPSNIFKAVYSPTQHRAAVYLVRNAPGSAWATLSLDQLEQMAGVDVFPGVGVGERRTLLALPEPR